jgi:hypothetical protein
MDMENVLNPIFINKLSEKLHTLPPGLSPGRVFSLCW